MENKGVIFVSIIGQPVMLFFLKFFVSERHLRRVLDISKLLWYNPSLAKERYLSE